MRKLKSPPSAPRPDGLLKPALESSTSISTLVACASISSRLVAAMSARNSGVNAETAAGVSLRRALRRDPLVVLAAW